MGWAFRKCKKTPSTQAKDPISLVDYRPTTQSNPFVDNQTMQRWENKLQILAWKWKKKWSTNCVEM